MSGPTYRPQGEGAHSTLAANVLDPGVKADGAMNAGQGVGGAAPAKQKEEGMEHIKHHTEGLSGNTGVSGGQGSATGLGNSASGVSGMGVGRSTHGECIEHIKQNTEGLSGNTGVSGDQGSATGRGNGASGISGMGVGRSTYGGGLSSDTVPASNPGADDTARGIASGAGGQDSQGLVGTVKDYLGYGNATSDSEMEARNVGDYRAAGGDTSLSQEGEAAGLGAGVLGAGASGSNYQDSSATGGSSLKDSPAAQKDSSAVGSRPERETEAGSGAPRPADSDVTTGAPPTDSADPTTKDTADRSAAGGDKGEEGSDKPKKHASDREAAMRENTDAIPTAGGEKLGSKHWGESQKIPDVPPKRESEAGISSAEGQSDSTTRDNTAKNTGGASNPHDSSSKVGHDGAEKESFVEKVKEKLHIGHKDKS